MNYKIFTEHPNEEWSERWNEFLKRASFPTHYTTPNFFVDPFVRGGERFAVVSIQNEKITGVVTGIFDGAKIVSGLFVRPQFAIDKSFDVLKTAENLLAGLKEKGGENLEVAEFFSWEPIR